MLPFDNKMLNLDDLDFRIIKELGGSELTMWNVRESYSNIARKLGVDEETIRLRVKRARDRGFIPAWHLMINPLLMNFREADLDLEVQDEQQKPDAISRIKTVEGVYYVDDFRGREMLIGIYYESDASLARKVALVESFCGSGRIALWNRPFPPPKMKMGILDWEIIDSLREDAWRELDDVAESLGVSARSVQRRLSLMKDGKAIFTVRPPNVDVVGGLMCNFLVFCPDREKKRAADYRIHSSFNRIGVSDTSPEEFSTFGIGCENFSEADKVTAKLKAVEGVESVRMRVVKEIIIVQDWLESEIRKRIPASQASKAAKG